MLLAVNGPEIKIGGGEGVGGMQGKPVRGLIIDPDTGTLIYQFPDGDKVSSITVNSIFLFVIERYYFLASLFIS